MDWTAFWVAIAIASPVLAYKIFQLIFGRKKK